MQNDGMNAYFPPDPQAKQGEGCLGELSWLGMGLTLPIVNSNFYRKAAGRRLSSALLVFFVFGFLLTVLSTLALSNGLIGASQAIQRAYEQGDFPTIVIRDGQASVDGPQPYYIMDQPDMLIAIDTTGTLTGIDPNAYKQGMLLTRNEILILQDDGRKQSVTLEELQTVLGKNPLVLDQAGAQTMWQSFSGLITVVGFFGLAVWNMLVRLGYLALLALLLWPLVNQIRPGSGYQTAFSIGVYVLIPAMILHTLITRSGVSFCGLQTLLLVPMWGLALFLALRKPAAGAAEIAIRPWEMLLPLPLLALIAVDTIVGIPNGDIFLWALAAITLVAAVAIARLWPAPALPGSGAPPPGDPLS